MVLSAMVRVGKAVMSGIVLLPSMISADIEGARETDLPAIVIAREPGWMV